MIKGIIFDYGGVIGNNSSSNIYQAVSDEFGLSTDKIKKEFFEFIFELEKNEISEVVFWKKIAKNFDISDYKKLRKIWIEAFRKYAKIDERVLFLLKKLKNHYKLCLLSNRVPFYRKTLITKLINKIFPVVIYSFDVKMRKPEEEIYLHVLKKIRLTPKECIIIDDSKKNLSYPKKLNMKVIHFKSFAQFKKELMKKLHNDKIAI